MFDSPISSAGVRTVCFMEEQHTTSLIPTSYLDLFRKRTLGHLVTLNQDGSLQMAPVWIDYDGTYLLINTSQGYRKDLNVRQRPQVAIDMIDPDDPYRWLSIRGRVVEVTTEGAKEHMDRLASRYLGIDTYPTRIQGEIRVIFRIQPEHVACG